MWYNCSGSTQFQLNVNLNLELEHGKSHKVRNMSLFFFFFVSAEYIHTSFLSKKQQWVFRLKNMDILYLTRTQGKVYELWLVELDKFCPQKNVKVYYFWKCSKLKRKIREKGWNYLKWGLSEICKAKIVDRLLGKRLKRPKSLEYL